jgi:hypothetical protein
MSAIPCPIRLNECPGADSPITNTSSEAPDPFFYAGIGYNPYDPYNPIVIDQPPKTDCSTIVWSTISQAFADFIAAASAAGCDPPPCLSGDPTCVPNEPPFVQPPGFTTPVEGGNPPTHPPDFQQFSNDAQTVTVDCPNGTVFSLAFPAGAIVSPLMDPAVGPAWVEYINAWIHAFLLSQALDSRACMEIPNLTRRFPPTGRPPVWPPGCAWPPCDPTCWPTGIIWPDVPDDWTPGCPWPPTDCSCAPTNYPVTPGSKWPTKSYPHSPTTPSTAISAWPGWLCFGETLDPALNTYQVTGSGDWAFEISGGTEPPGTSLVKTGDRTAVLQGSPSAPGFYAWSVKATSGTKSVEVADALNVLGLVTDNLPDATIGTPYSEQLQGSGGTGPYTFTALSALPPGLTLASDGTISGTPT